MILTKKVDAYVKRYSILDENIQKAYSIMLGQCTELPKSKLKTTTDWTTVSTEFDLLGLMKTIRSVIFKFEDQRYLPLSLHHASPTSITSVRTIFRIQNTWRSSPIQWTRRNPYGAQKCCRLSGAWTSSVVLSVESWLSSTIGNLLSIPTAANENAINAS